MQPDYKEIDRIISIALSEDIGRGDLTSNIIIPENSTAKFSIKTNNPTILCGLHIARRVFDFFSNSIKTSTTYKDGDKLQANDTILKGEGSTFAILSAERTTLNLLRQMCGVATITNQFVEKTKNTKVKILDTRKTIPGIRHLQKYAVRIGNGYNHRFALDDGILIKDNHIAISGSITQALAKAKQHAPSLTRIEIECENIEQVKEAIQGGADVIMLDNMDIETIQKAVKLVNNKIPLEASGNVTLETVEKIAQTGVDYISVGMITNSPANIDISLEVTIN